MTIRWQARELDGLFAGQFEPSEYTPFLKSGELRLSYEGAAGFMGLAKLRLTEESPSSEELPEVSR